MLFVFFFFFITRYCPRTIELNRGRGPRRGRGRGVTDADVAEVTKRDAVIAVVIFFSDEQICIKYIVTLNLTLKINCSVILNDCR